jgi:hypothetical protein
LTDGIDWVSTFNKTAPSGNRTSTHEVEESPGKGINFPSMIFSSQPLSSIGKSAVIPHEADIAKKEKTIEYAQTFIDTLFVKTQRSVHFNSSMIRLRRMEMQEKLLSKYPPQAE